jgi:hypothetical protein
MAGSSSQFNSPTRKFLKPFKGLNKKIHEVTGKIFPGGAVENPPAGSNRGANFRQVGKSPEDRSGFPVQHLGDKK